MMAKSMARGNLFIVFGPSGAGKTSLVKALVDEVGTVVPSVSHTTRPMRPGEEAGVHYYFISRDEFICMRDEGQFLEHAEVFGNYYGTSIKQLENKLDSGNNVVLEIDWQGARQVSEKIPQSVSVCILPPSRQSLEQRLSDRGQDSAEVIKRRMAAAQQEISHFNEADFSIINDDFAVALGQLASIVQIGGLLTRCQQIRQQDLIAQLLA